MSETSYTIFQIVKETKRKIASLLPFIRVVMPWDDRKNILRKKLKVAKYIYQKTSRVLRINKTENLFYQCEKANMHFKCTRM